MLIAVIHGDDPRYAAFSRRDIQFTQKVEAAEPTQNPAQISNVGENVTVDPIAASHDPAMQYRPPTAIILHDSIEHWRMEEAAPGKMIEPGLVIYWFGADLYYANANYCSEQARMLVSRSPTPVRWLVLDTGAIADIDYTAGNMLSELQRDLAKQGIVLALTRVSDALREGLQCEQLTDVIGSNHIFGSRRDCIAAYLTSAPGARAAS